MTELWTDKPPIGAEEVARAEQILQKYKVGKAALDQRLVDNELWFRMGHWKNYQNPMMEGKPQPSSGWLFNSIANKHADAMDNYPAPNVLPRAPDDEQTARVLSSVLPVVLEQADYEQVYSDTWWRKLKQGTGVKGVFWDPEQRGGVGEIAIRPMNLLMLYWEPGVDDIQASPHFFSLSLADTAQLESRWPQLAGHTASVLDVPHYIHDGGLDTSDKSVVVDWYYKKLSPEGRSVLHYCKFCNGVVLYASENDPALAERGFYDHGKYPFVFDALFMEEDSPAGFGYIDVMKECQTAIDKMNHAMDENVLLSSRQRYVLSDTAGVNEEELTDLSRDIIHVVGRLNDDSFRPLQTAGLQGNSLSYRNSRIEELKEISGNRDMTQGGTAGGVTAASAIAALQEAGSKLSRDMLKSAYRAFAKECYLIIELMRQFYDEERIFRITAPDKVAVLWEQCAFDPAGPAHHINFGALEEEHCRLAFLRGAFLAGGSVTDPQKGYHLELATTHLRVSRELNTLLLELGYAPKETTRKANYITYFKQSEAIEDLLTAIGAPIAAMTLMNTKAEKFLRNGVNRRVNCEAANVAKTVDAALEQRRAIQILRKSGALDELTPKLQEAAQLREAHPELSLSQLAALCDPPVTKSSLSHRLRKLIQLSQKGEP